MTTHIRSVSGSRLRDRDTDAAVAAVRAGPMRDLVDALAGDRAAGRRVGSAGGGVAREHLSRWLDRHGIRPSAVSFPVPAVAELYTTPRLVWSDGSAVTTLEHRREFVEDLAGADASEFRRGGLAILASPHVSDRWLIVAPGGSVADAAARGPAGLLVPRHPDAGGWLPKMLAGPASGPVPILAVRADIHARMASVAAAGNGWAQATTPLRRTAVTGVNLHARIHAPEPGEPDVLMTAHYDGVGDDPHRRLPAAADNASGVAVAAHAATILARRRPGRLGLQLALLDGEEVGAAGSAHHAAMLAAAEQSPLVINIDGAADLREAVAVEAAGPADGLLAALDAAGRYTGTRLAPGAVASDNRRYAAAGLPAIGLGAGVPGYHTPADTPDRVRDDTLTAVARLVVATVWQLAH